MSVHVIPCEHQHYPYTPCMEYRPTLTPLAPPADRQSYGSPISRVWVMRCSGHSFLTGQDVAPVFQVKGFVLLVPEAYVFGESIRCQGPSSWDFPNRS